MATPGAGGTTVGTLASGAAVPGGIAKACCGTVAQVWSPATAESESWESVLVMIGSGANRAGSSSQRLDASLRKRFVGDNEAGLLQMTSIVKERWRSEPTLAT